MKKSTVRLAIEALQKQRRRISVEANLFKLGVVTHATVNANAEYEQITDAIADLTGDLTKSVAVNPYVSPED